MKPAADGGAGGADDLYRYPIEELLRLRSIMIKIMAEDPGGQAHVWKGPPLQAVPEDQRYKEKPARAERVRDTRPEANRGGGGAGGRKVIGLVTEPVSVDGDLLQRHRADLKQIASDTGAEIREKAGLRGKVTVMITGTTAIVERALPLVEDLLTASGPGPPAGAPAPLAVPEAPPSLVVPGPPNLEAPGPPNLEVPGPPVQLTPSWAGGRAAARAQPPPVPLLGPGPTVPAPLPPGQAVVEPWESFTSGAAAPGLSPGLAPGLSLAAPNSMPPMPHSLGSGAAFLGPPSESPPLAAWQECARLVAEEPDTAEYEDADDGWQQVPAKRGGASPAAHLQRSPDAQQRAAAHLQREPSSAPAAEVTSARGGRGFGGGQQAAPLQVRPQAAPESIPPPLLAMEPPPPELPPGPPQQFWQEPKPVWQAAEELLSYSDHDVFWEEPSCAQAPASALPQGSPPWKAPGPPPQQVPPAVPASKPVVPQSRGGPPGLGLGPAPVGMPPAPPVPQAPPNGIPQPVDSYFELERRAAAIQAEAERQAAAEAAELRRLAAEAAERKAAKAAASAASKAAAAKAAAEEAVRQAALSVQLEAERQQRERQAGAERQAARQAALAAQLEAEREAARREAERQAYRAAREAELQVEAERNAEAARKAEAERMAEAARKAAEAAAKAAAEADRQAALKAMRDAENQQKAAHDAERKAALEAERHAEAVRKAEVNRKAKAEAERKAAVEAANRAKNEAKRQAAAEEVEAAQEALRQAEVDRMAALQAMRKAEAGHRQDLQDEEAKAEVARLQLLQEEENNVGFQESQGSKKKKKGAKKKDEEAAAQEAPVPKHVAKEAMRSPPPPAPGKAPPKADPPGRWRNKAPAPPVPASAARGSADEGLFLDEEDKDDWFWDDVPQQNEWQVVPPKQPPAGVSPLIEGRHAVAAKPPPSLPARPTMAPPPPPHQLFAAAAAAFMSPEQIVSKKAPPPSVPATVSQGVTAQRGPGAPGPPSGPPPKVAKAKPKAGKPGPPPAQAMNPLPQQQAGTRGLKAAAPRQSMSDNAATSAKWAERPVERLSATQQHYEEEEDPELAQYIWNRRSQRPVDGSTRAAPKPMQARVQAPMVVARQPAAPPPPPQRQRQMLQQVMDMGFDEPSAKRALSSTGWMSVEEAIGMLFG